MNWSEYLQENEIILWQGRPAPRCFTFRNWPHSLFGIVILLAAICWLFFGVELGQREQNDVFAWIPLPFLLVGLYLSVGHLLLSRLEWERVFYVLTEKRLMAVRGLLKPRIEAVDAADIIWFELRPHGEQLGTVRVRCRDLQQKLTVSCVEYPQKLTTLLEATMQKNGIDTAPRSD